MSLAFDPLRRKNQNNSPWTRPIIDRLRELWKTDMRIEQCASVLCAEFGAGFSWRAVHRKAQRLGLTKRDLFAWPAGANERLRGLWSGGQSGEAIASVMSEEFAHKFTRNAILARARRLNLESREPRGGRRKETDPAKLAQRAQRTLEKKREWGRNNKQRANGYCRRYYEKLKLRRLAPQIEDWSIPTPRRKTLFQLGPHDCRWPVGEPRSPEFFFCAAAAENNKPYCSSHCQRAYIERAPY